MRILAPVLATLVLAGCAHTADTCPAGMQAMWRAQLMFGRNVGATLGVSESDWQTFAAEEITPRFASGYTVIDAAGVWRGSGGATVQEPSKVVTILAPAGGETRLRLNAVAAAYKLRFHQDAVGIATTPTCASF